MERRDFLKIAGVTGAGTATFGCSPKATEKLIPYLVPQEEIVPGVATWYASVCGESPEALGIQVKTREGRPILIQGNPQHPLSGGAVSALAQASLQGLYDPDRVKGPAVRSSAERFKAVGWEQAERLLAEKLAAARGGGITFLGGQVTGSLDALIDRWLAALGSPNRVTYEAYAHEPLLAANRLVFGQEAIPHYDLARARYLISFGADFLETWVAPTFFARGFAAMHAFRDGGMGKFVHVEPRLSLTASRADEWIAPRPGTEMLVALAMANAIAGGGAAAGISLAGFTPEAVAERTEVPAETIRRLAREFADATPSLALGGGVATTHRKATETWTAVNVLNQVAGNVGQTVRFGATFHVARGETYRGMEELVRRMRDGRVQVLIVHGANPVFTLPPRLGFAEALRNVPFKVSLSTFYDETAAMADLLAPASHSLESWGDSEPVDGVRGLMQPVIQPLHDTRMLGDIFLRTARVAGVAGELPYDDFYAFLREAWGGVAPSGAGAAVAGVDAGWQEALRRGGVFAGGLAAAAPNAGPGAVAPVAEGAAAGGAVAPAGGGSSVRLAATFAATAQQAGSVSPLGRPASATDLVFEPAAFDGAEDGRDGEGFYLMPVPSVPFYDGRGANKPWMQELPDPVTKAVWGSWVEIHPETARRLGVREGDMLEVASAHGTIAVPAFLYPGIRPDTVAIPIGQGHTEYGRFAKGKGANPIALLPPEVDPVSGGRVWFGTRVTLRPSAAAGRLISLQGSPHQHSRGVALALSLPEAQEAAARPKESETARLMEKIVADAAPESPYRWGMTIDLAKCVGCSACVTACYMENNIATVGPDDCEKGRERSWLRIERYWEEPEEPVQLGAPPELAVRYLPMLCQHCGQAPCEPVCPVYAAYHTPEGLNAQVYNRCVGTRYCANNCPYKVRRFGFFEHPAPEPLNLQFNPDVTVRSKGVMEKCTFCVQRIREAKIQAKGEGREVQDGEVVTACQAACPTQAIVFGNLRDPQSRVYREAMSGRGYSVLASLNTRSAVTYLADVVHTERPLRQPAGHGERAAPHGPGNGGHDGGR
jgi:anaerobic selenocysteine-containing dehydrogenase/Fe-S-cluster-containing dehydrogenase component